MGTNIKPTRPSDLLRLLTPYLQSGGWKKTSQIYSYMRVNNIKQSKKFLLTVLNTYCVEGETINGEKTWIL